MQVSVIIPTYNRASLLKQTLESVLAQSYSNWECIVVDDGSTDETEAVTRQYGSNVRYVYQNNAGPAAARNRGFEEATGDSILFLDSDDLPLPQAIDVLVEELNQHPEAGVAYGGFYGIWADGSPGRIPEQPHLPDRDYVFPWPEQYRSGDRLRPYGLTVSGSILPSLLKHDAVLMGTSLIRKSALEETGGFDSSLDLMEHWELFLRLARSGVQFEAAKRPVLRVRMHGGNLSGDFEGMLYQRIKMIEEYLPAALSETSESEDSLRKTARANAYGFLGVCMCSSGDLEHGLRCLRSTLEWRSLSIEAYDALTQTLCARALSVPKPEQKLRTLLKLLGPSPNARSLKHFVLSRFYRVRASRRLHLLNSNGTSSWKAIGHWKDWTTTGLQMGLEVGRSGLHLGGAVTFRPKLGRTYVNRLLRRLQ